jgi:hypothetical protein
VVALCGRARRGCPVWPDHAGGGRLAPRCPREDPPSPGTVGHRHGRGYQPRYACQTPPTSRVRGKASRLEALPPGGAKAGPQVESWGVRSRLSALVAEMTSLHDTAGQQVPRWEPFQFSLLAWSPPLVRVAYPRALRVSPYGQHDEMTLRFHYPTPPAFIRGPQPRPAGRAQRIPR